MKGYGIYVKNDLLESKHYHSMGQSLWLYLWLLDKMTSISETGKGKVLGGAPIKLSLIFKDLPLSDRSYTRYVDKLEAGGYIEVLRTPYGYVFTVIKAKKKFGRDMERTVKLAPRTVNVAGENRKCGGNKEDSTVDSTIDIGEQSSQPLKDKEKDMGWNNQSEDEDLVIDAETGEVTNPVQEKKKESKEVTARKRELVDWLIKYQGRDPVRTSIPKQLKALNRIIEMRVTGAEAQQIIMEQMGNDFWRGKKEKPDFSTVVAIIEKRGE